MVGFASIAVLPGGLAVSVHEYVSESPSTSEDPLPSSVMVVPTKPVWFGPAFATGFEFRVVMITVAGSLFTVPSLTISWATYVPALSSTKVG